MLFSYFFKSHKKLREFKGHEQVVTCLVVQDEILYSGSKDETIRVWSTTTGECIKRLNVNKDSELLSPDLIRVQKQKY